MKPVMEHWLPLQSQPIVLFLTCQTNCFVCWRRSFGTFSHRLVWLRFNETCSVCADRSTSRPRLWRTYRRTAARPCAPSWAEPWRGTPPCGAPRLSCWRTTPWTPPGRTSRAAGASTRPWRRPPTCCYGSPASTTTPRRVGPLEVRSKLSCYQRRDWILTCARLSPLQNRLCTPKTLAT